jgi:DNA-binding NtrC family response regulator
MAKILIADHLVERRNILSTFLRADEHVIVPVSRDAEALKSLREFHPDLVILEGTVGGTKVLSEAKELDASIAVIMIMAAPPTVEQTVELMNQGVGEVLVSPLDITDVQTKVGRALMRRPATDAVEIRFHDLVGPSLKMQQVFKKLVKAAAADSPVLIIGEPGTGKTLVAAHIHRLSSRKDRPFRVALCAGLSAQELESELFGHEQGVFPWAVERKPGQLELADGGVLYLDEAVNLTLPLQARLLRCMEEQTLHRLGGTRTLSANVRLLASSCQNLTQRVEEGTFRSDLYYRLSANMVELPPLRARVSDVPELVELFLSRYDVQIAGEAMEVLMNYPWPGNVDELRNAVEQAVNLCDGNRIELKNLPSRVLKAVALRDRQYKYVPRTKQAG